MIPIQRRHEIFTPPVVRSVPPTMMLPFGPQLMLVPGAIVSVEPLLTTTAPTISRLLPDQVTLPSTEPSLSSFLFASSSDDDEHAANATRRASGRMNRSM